VPQPWEFACPTWVLPPAGGWYRQTGLTSSSQLGGYRGYGISKKGHLMGYVSTFCAPKTRKIPKKMIKITKKGNLIDYVSRLSCAKNSEKIPKIIKKYGKNQ
jgi:hypothetical protein